MAEIRCPQCGKPNPKELEECQFCGARIKPTLASTPIDSQPIKAGEEPIKRDTSEFEKVKPPAEGPIRPGEAPTKKNTAELERALPSWLQSLRKGEEPAGEIAGSTPGIDMPAASQSGTSTGTSDLDWLAGLGQQAASEESEEVPDWLASLRGGNPTPAEPDTTPDANIPVEEADWMKSLGNELRAGAQEPGEPALAASASNVPPASSEDFPDWLKGLQEESASSSQPAAPQESGDMPSWLSDLPGEPAAQTPVEPPVSPTPAEELPDWLDQFKDKTTAPAPEPAADADSTPDWLAGLSSTGIAIPAAAESLPEAEAAPSSGLESTGEMPDWLNQLKQKASEPETASGSEPDWLNSFGTEPGTPTSAPGESTPEWLSNLEQKSGAGSGTPAAVFGGEIVDGGAVPGEAPDWLSKLQADMSAAQQAEEQQEEFEVAPPVKKDTGPLPDWLSGIETTEAAASAAPALIVGDESNASGQEGEAAFAMETPDWLSKLKPEEREKAAQAEPETAGEENLEAAELPSWVQAMRPVEAVVSAEPKTTPLEEVGGPVEQSGPLAGLQGVLPAAPGLGPLRKPPAYSIKLQVTENQQKYAAYLERLVSQETQAKGPGAARLASSRLWRWLITALLFAVVLLSLLTGVPSMPESGLQPPEMVDAFTAVGNLAPDSAVLVVFDYDPALFGELEAAAAPVIDHLLVQGPRLAIISTSPTGPALAEQFLLETQASHQYKRGVQYVDLGYLAGGPTGVLGFASNPRATSGADGDWDLPPLANVDELSDFALIIILTDNADTGRVWIEQTRAAIDNDTPAYTDDTPILMAISAQAEPMLLPYYDSGQVQGIVTGLVGGKTYEETRDQSGLASGYWGAFSMATTAAVLLITGGAVWGALTSARARKNKTGEEA